MKMKKSDTAEERNLRAQQDWRKEIQLKVYNAGVQASNQWRIEKKNAAESTQYLSTN